MLRRAELLSVIAQIDRTGAWRDSGARDVTHWLWMRYGMSEWKARRWIVAAHVLQSLPRIDEALSSGEIGIDKVVELCRFATHETEQGLLAWAARVSSGAIRRRGDLEAQRSLHETREIEQTRYLRTWTFDEGRRVGIEGVLAASQGLLVAAVLEEELKRVPEMPGEEGDADARRADALVALCLGRAGARGTAGATVVVHASVEALPVAGI